MTRVRTRLPRWHSLALKPLGHGNFPRDVWDYSKAFNYDWYYRYPHVSQPFFQPSSKVLVLILIFSLLWFSLCDLQILFFSCIRACVCEKEKRKKNKKKKENNEHQREKINVEKETQWGIAFISKSQGRGTPHDLVASVMDCATVVSEIELPSRYYVYFQTNICYGLNDNMTVLLQGWLWY